MMKNRSFAYAFLSACAISGCSNQEARELQGSWQGACSNLDASSTPEKSGREILEFTGNTVVTRYINFSERDCAGSHIVEESKRYSFTIEAAETQSLMNWDQQSSWGIFHTDEGVEGAKRDSTCDTKNWTKDVPTDCTKKSDLRYLSVKFRVQGSQLNLFGSEGFVTDEEENKFDGSSPERRHPIGKDSTLERVK